MNYVYSCSIEQFLQIIYVRLLHYLELYIGRYIICNTHSSMLTDERKRYGKNYKSTSRAHRVESTIEILALPKSYTFIHLHTYSWLAAIWVILLSNCLCTHFVWVYVQSNYYLLLWWKSDKIVFMKYYFWYVRECLRIPHNLRCRRSEYGVYCLDLILLLYLHVGDIVGKTKYLFNTIFSALSEYIRRYTARLWMRNAFLPQRVYRIKLWNLSSKLSLKKQLQKKTFNFFMAANICGHYV